MECSLDLVVSGYFVNSWMVALQVFLPITRCQSLLLLMPMIERQGHEYKKPLRTGDRQGKPTAARSLRGYKILGHD